jgi:hypothetical protein
MEFIMDNIQAEKIVHSLRQAGTEVTIEQAKLIIELLQKLAEIFVSHYLQDYK